MSFPVISRIKIVAEIDEIMVAWTGEKIVATIDLKIAGKIADGKIAAEIHQKIVAEIDEKIAAEIDQKIIAEIHEKVAAEIDQKIVAEIDQKIVAEIEAKKEAGNNIIAICIAMKVMIQLATKNHLIFGWLKII